MNKYIIGSTRSGKTVYIKKTILDNLKIGKPSIYINFNKASREFSEEVKSVSLIVNANSFTQISKIKEKEYKNLVLIDFTTQRNKLTEKIKAKVLLEVMKNENWLEHDIYVDEGYLISNFDAIKNIRRAGDHYYSIMDERDLNGSRISSFEDKIIFRTISYENPEIGAYLTYKEDHLIKYVEIKEGEKLFKEIILSELDFSKPSRR